MAGDGCVWVNKGDKAVRFSLIASGTARVVTVLAPGESFKEADKTYCVAGAGDASRYEASFAVLAKMPDEDAAPVKVAKPVPRAKPAIVPVAAVAPAVTPVASEVAVATVSAVPLPRAKPSAPTVYPPVPRIKPEVARVAEAAASAGPAPVAVALTQPTAAVDTAPMPLAECGSACPPVLFKVVDDCLWVVNPNPRAVAFEAEIAGKRTALTLQAADGAKADADAAAGKAAKGVDAVHMRLADPFQSAGSGIPVFRARLGSAGACVKARGEITRFTASYVK